MSKNALVTTQKVELKTKLALQIKGEIVSSNLPAYATEIKDFIAALPSNLNTDEDFDSAKINIKSIKEVEGAVKLAKEETLMQAKDVYAVLNELDSISDVAAKTRLSLKKLIDAEEIKVKDSIIDDGVDLINIVFDSKPAHKQRLIDAMGKKRNMKTRREAVNLEAQEVVAEHKERRAIIDKFVEEHGKSISYDEGVLLDMAADSLRVELDRRLERQRHEEEQARLKLEAEAAEKKAKDAEEHHGKTSLVNNEEELPEAPKIGSIEVKNSADTLTQEQEIDNYLAQVLKIFTPMKPAREALIHAENQKHVLEFATSINEAYKTLKGRVSS